MALRYPDVVGGLILCDTSPAMAPLPDDEGDPAPSFPSRGDAEALAVATRIFSGEITDETVSLFLRHVAPFYAAPEHMSVVADLLALTTVDIPMMQHFMHSIAPSYDLRTEVGKIRAPALVMVGRHDWVCPPRASRFLARTMPHATLIEFGDSGHFPFSEVPKRFFEEVSSFLKAHANGRSPQ
jgi:proline iminopeptidase